MEVKSNTFNFLQAVSNVSLHILEKTSFRNLSKVMVWDGRKVDLATCSHRLLNGMSSNLWGPIKCGTQEITFNSPLALVLISTAIWRLWRWSMIWRITKSFHSLSTSLTSLLRDLMQKKLYKLNLSTQLCLLAYKVRFSRNLETLSPTVLAQTSLECTVSWSIAQTLAKLSSKCVQLLPTTRFQASVKSLDTSNSWRWVLVC